MSVPSSDPLTPGDLLQRRLRLAQLRARLGLAVTHVAIEDDHLLRIALAEDVDSDALAGLRAGATPAPANTTPPPPLNIAMLVVGSRGDVQPFIPIAKRLMRDGHRVRLATHACFRQFVESHGVEFFPLAGDPKELMAYMVMTGGKLIPTSVRQIVEEVPKKRRMVGEIVASTWAACTQADPARPDAASFVADAIIANPPSYGHLHCAEALHVPLHIMFTMPWTPTTAVPHPFAAHATEGRSEVRNWMSYATFELLAWLGVADVINEFREQTLGLEPLHVADHAAGLLGDCDVPHSYLWSSELLPKPEDWNETISVTGFVFLDERAEYAPPAETAAFLAGGPAPIYVGFGSCPVPDPAAATRIIVDALAACGARGILAQGWGRLGEIELPPHVHVVEEVPHDWLFPRCAAVCHHGGAGTVAAGLRAGRPTVVVPFFGDQHFWGRLVAAAGGAPAPIPIADLSAERLAEAFAFCQQPEVRQHAAALGEKVRAQQGEEEAVASLYRHLPLAAMRCAIDAGHLARWFCDQCALPLCSVCEAALHGRRARADHVRHPYRYVDWAARRPELSLEHVELAVSEGVRHSLADVENLLARALQRGVALIDAARQPSAATADDEAGPLRRHVASLADHFRHARPEVDATTRRRIRRRLAALQRRQGTAP